MGRLGVGARKNRGREKKRREVGVLKERKGGEKRGKYATRPNISKLTKGLREETENKRHGDRKFGLLSPTYVVIRARVLLSTPSRTPAKTLDSISLMTRR